MGKKKGNNHKKAPVPSTKTTPSDFKMGWKCKGIQGANNSCFMDSTLYSMFSMTSAFDHYFLSDNRNTDSDASVIIEYLYNIIENNLRRKGYCPSHYVQELRNFMTKHNPRMQSEMMDVDEFVQTLFSRCLKLPSFIHYVGGFKNFLHQIFLIPDGQHSQLTDVQTCLEKSMKAQGLTFSQVPSPALFIKMPRSNGRLLGFDYIIPNTKLDLSSVTENSESKDNLIMDLHAVICLRSLHYTTFVKSNDNSWVYFNSMPPTVTEVGDLTIELDRMSVNYRKKLNHKMDQLMSDIHVCIYLPSIGTDEAEVQYTKRIKMDDQSEKSFLPEVQKYDRVEDYFTEDESDESAQREPFKRKNKHFNDNDHKSRQESQSSKYSADTPQKWTTSDYNEKMTITSRQLESGEQGESSQAQNRKTAKEPLTPQAEELQVHGQRPVQLDSIDYSKASTILESDKDPSDQPESEVEVRSEEERAEKSKLSSPSGISDRIGTVKLRGDIKQDADKADESPVALRQSKVEFSPEPNSNDLQSSNLNESYNNDTTNSLLSIVGLQALSNGALTKTKVTIQSHDESTASPTKSWSLTPRSEFQEPEKSNKEGCWNAVEMMMRAILTCTKIFDSRILHVTKEHNLQSTPAAVQLIGQFVQPISTFYRKDERWLFQKSQLKCLKESLSTDENDDLSSVLHKFFATLNLQKFIQYPHGRSAFIHQFSSPAHFNEGSTVAELIEMEKFIKIPSPALIIKMPENLEQVVPSPSIKVNTEENVVTMNLHAIVCTTDCGYELFVRESNENWIKFGPETDKQMKFYIPPSAPVFNQTGGRRFIEESNRGRDPLNFEDLATKHFLSIYSPCAVPSSRFKSETVDRICLTTFV